MSEGQNEQNEMVENNSQQGMSREEMAIAALEEQGLLTSRETEAGSEEGNEEGSEPAASETQTATEATSEEPTEQKGTEPSETQEATSDTFDESAYLNERFEGRFKSVDEIMEQLKAVDSLQNEIQDLRNSQTEPTKFANEYIEGLNNYVLNGGDAETYASIVAADYDKMDDIAAIKADYMNRHGLSSDEADTLLNNRYQLDPDTYTEDEIRLAKVTMKVDANESRKRLKETQDSVRVPEAQQAREEAEASLKESMEKWDDESYNFAKSMSELSFSEQKELGDFKYELSEEDAKSIDDMMFDAVEASKMEYTEENIEAMRATVRDQFIGRNFNKILGAALKYALSSKEKETFTEQHNPTPVPETEVPTDPAKEPTRSEIAEDIFMKELGLR